MATSDGAIVLSVEIDKSSMESASSQLKSTSGGMNTLNTATQTVTTSLKKFAGALGIAFSVAQIVKFSKEASELASQTESYLARLNILYGESAQKVYDWANANSASLGMAKSEAYEAAADFGNLLTTSVSAAESAELSIKLMQATAVMASQTGRTYEETLEKVRSGIYGNTRAIDDLGVSVRQKSLQQTRAWQTVSQNGTKSWNDLTDAELQYLRVIGIIEQTQDHYGDEVLQTSALTRAQFNAAWTDFKATWGQAVNIVLMPILSFLTKILNAATAALSAVLKFFGKELSLSSNATQGMADNIGAAADNQDALTDSVKGTNKELKKTLAGFDELQILSDNSSDSGSGGSGGDDTSDAVTATPTLSITDAEIETTAWDNLLQKLTEIKEIFLSGFWEAFKNSDFSGIENSIQSIKTSVSEIWNDPNLQTSLAEYVTTVAYSLGQMTGSVASIGKTIAENILGGIALYLSENKKIIIDRLVSIIDSRAAAWEIVGDFFSAIADVFSGFASEAGQRLTAAIIGIFTNTFLGVVDLVYQIGVDLLNMLLKPFIDNKDKFKTAFENMLKPLANIAEGVKSTFDTIIQNVLQLYEKHISPLITKITDTISNIVGKIVDAYNTYLAPVLEKISVEFKTLMETVINPLIDKIGAFLGIVIDKLSAVWSVISPVLEWLGGFIATVIYGTLATALKVIWKILKTIVKILADIVSGAIDVATKLIEWFGVAWKSIKAVWELVAPYFKALWETIKIVFSAVKNFFETTFSSAWEAIKIIWNGVKGYFQTVWDNIKLIFSVVKSVLSGNFSDAWEAIKSIVNNWKKYFSDRWDDIKAVFSVVKDWFKDTFTNAWEAIKQVFANWGSFFGDLWNTVKEKFTNFGRNIGEAVGDAVKSGINLAIIMIENTINKGISLINGAIKLINKLPGVSVDSIGRVDLPRLAQGAVIPANREFLAILGDQKHGTNIEAPAELIKQMAKEAYQEMGLANNQQQQIIKEEHYNLNQTELMTIMYKLVKGGERLNGTSLVKQGGI